jgi:ferredoxin
METEHDTCYQVVFDLPSGEVTIQVRSDEFILDAARRAGLDLPSLCERGWCMTCATRIVSGSVDQSASFRYYDADRQAGFVLICTARPRSDLRLRPYAVEAMRAHRDAHHLPAPRGTGSE